MATRATFLLVGLSTALLAGCADDAPAATDEAPPVEAETDGMMVPAAGAPVSRSGGDSFGWLLFAGVPGMGPDAGFFTSLNSFPIEVLQGASRLDVNASWTCATPTCTVHFYLYAPGEYNGGSALRQASQVHGEGDGQASFSVEAPATGTWTLNLYPDGATADVTGEWSYVVTYPPAPAAASGSAMTHGGA